MSNNLSQQGHALEFDVLVIGTGLAGLNYCLQLLKLQPNLNIALISKAEITECNSRYAQGGIAAAVAPGDSLESHIMDTLHAGDGLCYQPAVEFIIRQGPQAIKDLMGYPIPFTKQSGGDFSLAQEGGHSHRRIFNSGDQTGLAVTEALLQAVKQQPQICFLTIISPLISSLITIRIAQMIRERC